MNDQNFPSDAGAEIYLLTVLGTPKGVAPDKSADLHNMTAGSAAGVAAAKALGDLSHNVYIPALAETRLLFLDTWNSVQGLGQFFADKGTQEGAGALWADYQPALWMPAEGFGSYSLPAPSGRSAGAVGLMRAPVSSYAAAAAAFHADSVAKINASRQHGMVGHSLWVPVPMGPGQTPATEVLGVDYWI
ncbi:MAG: hypothetical protein V4479_04370, partial [Actinomycetota bacterium]